jgi:hypothetical protein
MNVSDPKFLYVVKCEKLFMDPKTTKLHQKTKKELKNYAPDDA